MPEPMPEIVKPETIIPTQYTAMPARVVPPQIIPEPFVSSTFETKEYKSDNIEIKKEITQSSETISGYRHVEPPKFSQRGKSTEPLAPFVAPTPFTPAAPAPFTAAAAPPLFSDLFKAKEPEPPKQQEQVKQIPIQIQRPDLVKPSFIPPPIPVQSSPIQPPHKPAVTQPKPIVTKPKYGEIVSETTQKTHSLYKNFVKSEQSMQSTESYFQRIESPKTVVPPQQSQQFIKNEQQSQQFSQVRKKFYPDVML
jgi:hypothetical protein